VRVVEEEEGSVVCPSVLLPGGRWSERTGEGGISRGGHMEVLSKCPLTEPNVIFGNPQP